MDSQNETAGREPGTMCIKNKISNAEPFFAWMNR